MTPRIPPELLLQIFEEVESKADLLSIRSANMAMSSLVTATCFRTIKVADTLDRAAVFISLQRHPTLASLVERIVFTQKVERGWHGAATVQYGDHEDRMDRQPAGDLYSFIE